MYAAYRDWWTARGHRQPATETAPPKPFWEQLAEEIIDARADAPDLVAESEQRAEAAPDIAFRELAGFTGMRLFPPVAGPYGPDPLVFGPQYRHADPHSAPMSYCWCGAAQAMGEGNCWNCGKPP
jgi:hypothetical protein